MATLSNVRGGAAAIDAPITAAPVAAAPAAVAPAAPVSNGVTLIDGRNAIVVDSRGRSIKIRRLAALDQMKLYKAVGAESSENQPFMFYARIAAAVREFDGEHVPFPANQIQLSALVGRLDDEGLEAVMKGLVALNPEQEDAKAVAKN